MDKLVQTIETVRDKLGSLRRQTLKEFPTQTIVINPLLEALGWDVRDQDEVQLEYPTVDGKSVDYALKLNKEPVLFVEAKALDDPLTDVKAITQVVGYAANAGIVWCVLTNGVKWQVYRSVEKCAAPDKLMWEVSLDPAESEGISEEQLAQKLWALSREEMAKGTLDSQGERVFTDSKVRKALDAIMRNPPRQLVNMVKRTGGDASLTSQQIKESLPRIWTDRETAPQPAQAPAVESPGQEGEASTRSQSDRKSSETRRARGEAIYEESHHTNGKPQEVLELYRAIDNFCLSLKPGEVEKRYQAKDVQYRCGKKGFCSVHLQQSGLRVWLKLKYGRLENPPDFARDVSNIGHWGAGDVELGISDLSQVQQATALIRMSFEGQEKAT